MKRTEEVIKKEGEQYTEEEFGALSETEQAEIKKKYPETVPGYKAPKGGAGEEDGSDGKDIFETVKGIKDKRGVDIEYTIREILRKENKAIADKMAEKDEIIKRMSAAFENKQDRKNRGDNTGDKYWEDLSKEIAEELLETTESEDMEKITKGNSKAIMKIFQHAADAAARVIRLSKIQDSEIEEVVESLDPKDRKIIGSSVKKILSERLPLGARIDEDIKTDAIKYAKADHVQHYIDDAVRSLKGEGGEIEGEDQGDEGHIPGRRSGGGGAGNRGITKDDIEMAKKKGISPERQMQSRLRQEEKERNRKK